MFKVLYTTYTIHETSHVEKFVKNLLFKLKIQV